VRTGAGSGARARRERRRCRAAITTLIITLTIVCGRSGLVALVLSGAAWAQGGRPGQSGPGDSVLDRARPEYDPVGARLGTLWFFPSLGLGVAHDDNVFAAPRNTVDDVLFTQAPRLVMESDFPRHALGLDVGAEIGRYLDQRTENYEDLRLETSGRIDVQRDTEILAAAGWARLHQDRSAPDDTGAREPILFRRAHADAAYRQSFNRVGLRVGGTVRHFDYDDAVSPAGPINSDDRDRLAARLDSRLSYVVADAYRAFIDMAMMRTGYRVARDDNGFDRDSRGREVFIGAATDPGGIIFGELMVGRIVHDPDDARFSGVSDWALRAGLTWNVTRLTSIRGGLSRDVEPTTVSGASAVLASGATLDIDHELLRNVVVRAGAAVRAYDFVGTAREDDVLTWTLGARYMLNRTLSLNLDYDGTERDSTRPDGVFSRNRVLLQLRLQL